MYNLEDLVGKIVTIKFISGIEVMAQLLANDEENNLLQLSEPRIVVINGEEIALIPYLFTGSSESISVPMSAVLSVVESLEKSAVDYEKIVEATAIKADK